MKIDLGALFRRSAFGRENTGRMVEEFSPATDELERAGFTGSSAARSERALRLLGALLAVSLGLNALLAIGISSLIPLKTIEPYFLSVQGENRIVYEVSPVRPQGNVGAILREGFVRQFIEYRHGILPDTEVATNRTRWLVQHAAKAVRDEYRTDMQQPISLAIKDGWRREIRDLSVEEQAEGWFIATWREVNLYPGADGQGQSRRRRAEIRVAMQPNDVPRELIGTDLANSLGLTIISHKPEVLPND